MTSKLNVSTIPPIYGETYKKGYIGFVNRDTSVMSLGIAFFTGWDSIAEIHTTHALIVTGENSCVEADAQGNCVKVSALKPYFDNPNCLIFFRKPFDLTETTATSIAELALNAVGRKYDFGAILAQAISGSQAGSFYDRLSRGAMGNTLANILESPDRWVCSELAAYVLDQQSKYKDLGILKYANAAISPQELFQDLEIFDAWRKG